MLRVIQSSNVQEIIIRDTDIKNPSGQQKLFDFIKKMIEDNSKASFAKQIDVIRDNTIEYITSVLKERGTSYQLIDPAEFDEEDKPEALEDLPMLTVYNKFNSVDYYRAIALNINDGVVSVEGLSDDGEGEDDKHIKLDDLETIEVIRIADLVTRLELGIVE